MSFKTADMVQKSILFVWSWLYSSKNIWKVGGLTDVRQRQQLVVFGQWLRRGDVKSGGVDVPVLQGIVQIVLVH